MKIKLTVGNGLVGCTRQRIIEIDKDVWEDMSPREQEQFMQDEMNLILEWSYEVLE